MLEMLGMLGLQGMQGMQGMLESAVLRSPAEGTQLY